MEPLARLITFDLHVADGGTSESSSATPSDSSVIGPALVAAAIRRRTATSVWYWSADCERRWYACCPRDFLKWMLRSFCSLLELLLDSSTLRRAAGPPQCLAQLAGARVAGWVATFRCRRG